jgi:hypothetical protein
MLTNHAQEVEVEEEVEVEVEVEHYNKARRKPQWRHCKYISNETNYT